MKLFLTDGDWARVAPLLPPPKPGGRPRTTDLRGVVEAILFWQGGYCGWRRLPLNYPPWGTCHSYYVIWRRSGVWARVEAVIKAGERRTK